MSRIKDRLLVFVRDNRCWWMSHYSPDFVSIRPGSGLSFGETSVFNHKINLFAWSYYDTLQRSVYTSAQPFILNRRRTKVRFSDSQEYGFWAMLIADNCSGHLETTCKSTKAIPNVHKVPSNKTTWRPLELGYVQRVYTSLQTMFANVFIQQNAYVMIRHESSFSMLSPWLENVYEKQRYFMRNKN